MADGEYWFTKSLPINLCGLRYEIGLQGFTQVFTFGNLYPIATDNLYLKFEADLTSLEETTLASVVAAHSGNPPPDQSNMGTVSTTLQQLIASYGSGIVDEYVLYSNYSKIVFLAILV